MPGFIKKTDVRPKWVSLRSLALLCWVPLADPRADAMSGLGKFAFLNPGITITKDGPGLELSVGRNGIGSGGALLIGALGRYEFQDHRKEAGVEFGVAIFLIEAGVSFSDKGSGEFFAPDLCLPLPLSGGGEKGLVLNLFYRIYPYGDNTFGGSLKFAWTWL